MMPPEMATLRNCPFNFREIEPNIRRFYTLLNSKKLKKRLGGLFKARNYLDSSRRFIKNKLVLEENIYIKNYAKNFSWMNDNLGRVDMGLKRLEGDPFDRLYNEESKNHKIDLNNPIIMRYQNLLYQLMEHLVYYPLKHALERFENLDEEVKRTPELFFYFVFVELYNASESLGSISAEPTRTLPKQPIINPYVKSSHEGSEDYVKVLPRLPEDIEKNEEEEIIIEDTERKELESDIFGEVTYEFDSEEDSEDSEVL